jgi:hypothetical protein
MPGLTVLFIPVSPSKGLQKFSEKNTVRGEGESRFGRRLKRLCDVFTAMPIETAFRPCPFPRPSNGRADHKPQATSRRYGRGQKRPLFLDLLRVAAGQTATKYHESRVIAGFCCV